VKQEGLLGRRGSVCQKPGERGFRSWLWEGHARFDAEDLRGSVNAERVGVKAVHFSRDTGYEGQDSLGCASLNVRRLLCTVIC